MAESNITDITWSMMSNAGIDIALVERQHTQLGVDEYVLIDGDTKVAFGPAVDMQEGGTHGWSVCTYVCVIENLGEDDGIPEEDHWQDVRQDWAETPGEVLDLVFAAVNPDAARSEP